MNLNVGLGSPLKRKRKTTRVDVNARDVHDDIPTITWVARLAKHMLEQRRRERLEAMRCLFDDFDDVEDARQRRLVRCTCPRCEPWQYEEDV